MGDWAGGWGLCMGCLSSSGMVLASTGQHDELFHKGRALGLRVQASALQRCSLLPGQMEPGGRAESLVSHSS